MAPLFKKELYMRSTSYPGYTIIFTFNNSRTFSRIKEEYIIKFIFPFVTIMFIKKNIEDMFTSYIDMMSERIKELEDCAKEKK